MFASLVIALVAMGLAIVCWFRPPPSNNASSTPPTPSYTDQQVATAKANVCGAFDKVQHAADFAKTHVGSNDYTTQLATAALTHVALDAGSRYLLTKLAAEPATPPPLADAVRNEANAAQEALIDYLNGLTSSDPAMQPTLKADDEAATNIRQLCK